MNRLRQEIADLHPAYAALVMATGIVSTGLALFGWDMLSDALLVVAIAASAVLLAAYAWRMIAYPRRVLADARDPGQGFGYFTLVAAPNVLGIRLALDHHLLAAAVLALASVPVWLMFTYAIPGILIVGHRREPILPRINGSWFMWVVGTQALSAAAVTLTTYRPDLMAALAFVAVALWGIGVVLYLMLTSLVTARLLDDPVTPHALSPTYWVYMGATAITVLAAAKILALPATLPVLVSTRQVVAGVAFLLWAFGTWWVPLLLIFAVWRYLVRGPAIGYEPTLWSMVFPLGMYAAASASYGRATGIEIMVAIAHVEVWVGFIAWTGVAIAMGRALLRPSRAGPARTADSDSPPGLTEQTG
jgi:tellurite resistance protein TehA-like permease